MQKEAALLNGVQKQKGGRALVLLNSGGCAAMAKIWERAECAKFRQGRCHRGGWGEALSSGNGSFLE